MTARRFLALAAGAALHAGCTNMRPAEPVGAPPGHERAWAVPQTASYAALTAARREAEAANGHPAEGPPAIDPDRAYELAELVDIAERTHPETRIAWERARQAALAMGMAQSVHAPMLSAKASAIYQHVPLPLPKTILTPDGFFVADTQAFLPALTLKWLLFDFGGKEASIDVTRETLAAANFGFNATHQKVVFEVSRAYYGLSAAQGKVQVARAAQKQLQVVLEATEARRGRGLATMPDVLQARERNARAAYDLQAALAGEIDARMGLLEAMGVTPTKPLRIADINARAVPAQFESAADALVERALLQRPDLLARAAVLRSREAGVRKAESEFYPKVLVSADLAQNIGRIRTSHVPGWATVNEPTYGAGLLLEVPLYDAGLRNQRLGVAQSELRVAEHELEQARDQATRQVVKAVEDVKSALRQREAASALLAAAQASYDAAIDSYRRGVASFVDVTNAEAALTRARTSDTDATSLVYTTMAALAFGTGDLVPAGADGSSGGEGPAGRKP